MSEIYSPSSENDISNFIRESHEQATPIEIIGQNTRPIGRLIQCSKTLKKFKWNN